MKEPVQNMRGLFYAEFDFCCLVPHLAFLCFSLFDDAFFSFVGAWSC